ncbi:DUF4411 family protein [Ramlibacter humi]|uniref:DUF4411 family protein n=1 Tax=Ramlibacter humi TaxID=2530451 RepID=A0A4Z0BGS2_9BURK|nr:DUF4411 family protein [Ramlibacter humi]TFY97663.1 DUF4411 family protein [Ramlibacter humi]
MPKPQDKYLFDSSVFIQAKNIHYRFGFCGGFWDWVKAGHGAGLFFSCKKVQAELNKGEDKDECKAWAKGLPTGFFVPDMADARVMQAYKDVIKWAEGSKHYLPAAKKEFAGADEADAFLVAVAKAHSYTIVSQELPNPEKKNRIPLPNAADEFKVKTIYVYDLLSKHAASTFQLKP